jgi:SAM-dependent methyltransferase
MLEYGAVNKHVIQEVSLIHKKILDVGCGTGTLGDYLKRHDPKKIITGVTYSPEEAKQAIVRLDNVYVEDINNFDFAINEKFDMIIFSHVLEHLYEPGNVLIRASNLLAENGVILVALPNVLFFKQRIEFLKGNFRYSKTGGIMDVTHYRFFDWHSTKELFTSSGLSIIKMYSTGHFPLPKVRTVFPNIANKLDNLAQRYAPGFFGSQFIVLAAKK